MPITQDRMIATIEAGLDAFNGLLRSRQHIIDTLQRFRAGRLAAEEALQEIELFDTDLSWLMKNRVLTEITLRAERKHFSSHRKKNETAKIWQRRKRGIEGDLDGTIFGPDEADNAFASLDLGLASSAPSAKPVARWQPTEPDDNWSSLDLGSAFGNSKLTEDQRRAIDEEILRMDKLPSAE